MWSVSRRKYNTFAEARAVLNFRLNYTIIVGGNVRREALQISLCASTLCFLSDSPISPVTYYPNPSSDTTVQAYAFIAKSVELFQLRKRGAWLWFLRPEASKNISRRTRWFALRILNTFTSRTHLTPPFPLDAYLRLLTHSLRPLLKPMTWNFTCKWCLLSSDYSQQLLEPVLDWALLGDTSLQEAIFSRSSGIDNYAFSYNDQLQGPVHNCRYYQFIIPGFLVVVLL